MRDPGDPAAQLCARLVAAGLDREVVERAFGRHPESDGIAQAGDVGLRPDLQLGTDIVGFLQLQQSIARRIDTGHLQVEVVDPDGLRPARGQRRMVDRDDGLARVPHEFCVVEFEFGDQQLERKPQYLEPERLLCLVIFGRTAVAQVDRQP